MCKVIICVRAKNEERWLRLLLRRLEVQSFQDFELVIVDNQSTDYTKQLAENGKATIVNIENYNPSAAINIGIKQAKSYDMAEIAVILSAHCIPVKVSWLEHLVKSFELDSDIVGVYGRQIPMRSSNPDNTRDLLYAFGDKSLTHEKNVFFHNANSAVKMDYYIENRFDERIAHIEDFAWAKAAIDKDKKIFYCSEAVVWHQHGLHQHSDLSFRSKSVSTTLLGLSGFQFPEEDIFSLKKLKNIFIHEDNYNTKPHDVFCQASKKVAADLGMLFFSIPPDKDRPLFSRLLEIIPEEIQLETDLVFFWSGKNGPVNANFIIEAHKILSNEGSDALVPVRELNKVLCVASENKNLKFTTEAALGADKFYTTSFGRGSLFWIDTLRCKNLEELKLSQINV